MSTAKPLETAMLEKLARAFSPIHVELENESSGHGRGGQETHFRLLIVSNSFEGKSRIDRQRSVQALFEAERAAGLHALALWTYTEAEYQKINPDFTASPPCAGQD